MFATQQQAARHGRGRTLVEQTVLDDTATPAVHDAMACFLAIYATMKYGYTSQDDHARRTLRRLLTPCR